MEFKELDGSIRQGYTSEIHVNENYRDWFSTTRDKFAEDNSCNDLMEISQPATSTPNDYDYDNNDHQQAEQVMRRSAVVVSDDSQHHYYKNQQQQHYAQQQTLDLGIGGQICNIEREHMFDKVVTPSDVGKLNRLVIPKQHAEKYFPLDSNSSNDQKGLLLNFEDVTGKTWRFRYSYWSSSQSYVMTKGWSRFVKDKKLDAGDVVSFQRGLGEADKHRLFIDWRRRPITNSLPIDAYHTQFYRSLGRGLPPSAWNNPLVFRPPPTHHQLLHPNINFQIPNQSSHYYSAGYGGGNYMGHQVVNENGSVVYLTTPEIGMLRGRGSAVGDRVPMVFESFPVVHGKKVVVPAEASAKKLRLFGVNMDCPISSDTSTSDEYEILSSSAAIQVNSSPTSYLNQYPSSSSMLLPSSTRMMYNSSTPVSNKGKTSMSLDFEI